MIRLSYTLTDYHYHQTWSMYMTFNSVKSKTKDVLCCDFAILAMTLLIHLKHRLSSRFNETVT